MRKAKNRKFKGRAGVFAGRKRPFLKEIFAFAKIFSILGLGFFSAVIWSFVLKLMLLNAQVELIYRPKGRNQPYLQEIYRKFCKTTF